MFSGKRLITYLGPHLGPADQSTHICGSKDRSHWELRHDPCRDLPALAYPAPWGAGPLKEMSQQLTQWAGLSHLNRPYTGTLSQYGPGYHKNSRRP